MKTRIVVTGALLIGLLGGAAGVSAIGVSTDEAAIRAGLMNCLLDQEAQHDGISGRAVLATHLACRTFEVRYHVSR